MSENNDMSEVKETIVEAAITGKFIGKLIAWFTGIMSVCTIALLTFIVKLHSEVPLMQKSQTDLQNAINTLQGSVNHMQLDNQDMKTNQSVMNEQIKNINQKLNYH